MAKNTGMMPNKSGGRTITGTVGQANTKSGGSTGRPHAHGGQVPANSVKHDGKMPSTVGKAAPMASTKDTDSMEARADRGEPAELRMAGRKESSVGTNEY